MPEGEPILAYVFFHAPGAAVAPATYEAGLTAFHRSLGTDPPEGFRASASYRIARLPWEPAPFSAAVYADWYVVRDWASLGRLNAAAVRPPHGTPHDGVAALSQHGLGGLYALQRGTVDLAAPRFERWSSKPAGVPSDAFAAGLLPGPGPEAAVWRRLLALGPAPEFCRRSVVRPESREGDRIVELRPVVAVSPG